MNEEIIILTGAEFKNNGVPKRYCTLCGAEVDYAIIANNYSRHTGEREILIRYLECGIQDCRHHCHEWESMGFFSGRDRCKKCGITSAKWY